jgi:hypothetical protein
MLLVSLKMFYYVFILDLRLWILQRFICLKKRNFFQEIFFNGKTKLLLVLVKLFCILFNMFCNN